MSEPWLSEAYAKHKKDVATVGLLMELGDGLINALAAETRALRHDLGVRLERLEIAGSARTITVNHEPGGGAAVADLQARIKALEAQPKSLAYLGVWTASGADYMKGHVVTRQGSMWHCDEDHCRTTPGTDGGKGWTLCCKSGRDARDLR